VIGVHRGGAEAAESFLDWMTKAESQDPNPGSRTLEQRGNLPQSPPRLGGEEIESMNDNPCPMHGALAIVYEALK